MNNFYYNKDNNYCYDTNDNIIIHEKYYILINKIFN